MTTSKAPAPLGRIITGDGDMPNPLELLNRPQQKVVENINADPMSLLPPHHKSPLTQVGGKYNKEPIPVDPNDIRTIVTKLRQAPADDAVQAYKQPVNGIERGAGWSLETFDLANPGGTARAFGITDPIGMPIDKPGYGLLYKLEGSNPGGRLILVTGDNIQDIWPGSRVFGFFKRVHLFRSTRSAVLGSAQLVIFQRPDANYAEPPIPSIAEPFAPIDLLGTSAGGGSFASQPVATVPITVNQAGAFRTNGVSNIRVTINAKVGAAAAMTTITLNPWVWDDAIAQWCEQGTQRIVIPDSSPTGQTRRVVNINVVGGGLMYLDCSANGGGAQANIGYIIQQLR